MEQYIPKSAVLAEIDKVMAEEMKFYETACKEGDEEVSSSPMVYTRLQILRSCIDTLEVKEFPIWEKVSPDTGQTTLYTDGCKSYLERFGYRIDLKDLDKLPKKNLKTQKGE